MGYPVASDNIVDVGQGASLEVNGDQAVNILTFNTNNTLSTLTADTLNITGGAKNLRFRGSTNSRTLAISTRNVAIDAGTEGTSSTIWFGFYNGVASNQLTSFQSSGTFTVGGLSATAQTSVNFNLNVGTTNLSLNNLVVNANASVRLNEGGLGTVAAVKYLRGNGGISYAGVLQNGAGGGTLTVVKNGAGTQEFTGASSYTGDTTINAGTLLVTTAPVPASARAR